MQLTVNNGSFIECCYLFQGNFNQLISLTGWSGSRVLYIGDHVYTDLAVRTGF